MSIVKEERMGVRGYHNEQPLNFVEAYSNEGKRLFAIIEVLRKEFENYLVWEGSASELVDILKERAKDYKSTLTSIGRFLNQRIACGSKLVEKVGQRKYKIDLREYEDFEVIDIVSERKEVETEEEVRSEDKQVYLLDDDEENFYGHYSG